MNQTIKRVLYKSLVFTNKVVETAGENLDKISYVLQWLAFRKTIISIIKRSRY